jgi:hypothetical protein
MRYTRIFEKRRYRLKPLRASLKNVTRTAREWGFPFSLRVQPELLRNYTPPQISDDEGYYLVGQITLLIDAVLHGSLPCRLASHGRYLAFQLRFTAQHRRRDTAESMKLWVLIGPCDSNRPVVCVTRIQPPF